MKFIKRFIFVLILLLIAFFVYRLINPSAAKALLYDVKSFSNDTLGTHFSLSGELLQSTWVILDSTGVLVQDTWMMQEITGDDELLLENMELPAENFDTEPSLTWTVVSTPTATTPSPTPTTTPTTQPTTTPKTTTTPKWLSSQDIRDLQTLFGN